MNRIFLRQLKMPLAIRAFTMPDANGDFNIYINMDLSPAQRDKTFMHELRHIKRGDFQKSIPARLIERDMK